MKLSQEQIDQIPGLKAAQENGNVTFLNMDTKDTSPNMTEGFRDEQIKEMSATALNAQLNQINAEEQNLIQMQLDLNKRRQTTLNILKRKQELL